MRYTFQMMNRQKNSPPILNELLDLFDAFHYPADDTEMSYHIEVKMCRCGAKEILSLPYTVKLIYKFRELLFIKYKLRTDVKIKFFTTNMDDPFLVSCGENLDYKSIPGMAA